MNVNKFFETLAKIIAEKNDVNIKVEVKKKEVKKDEANETSNRSTRRNKAV